MEGFNGIPMWIDEAHALIAIDIVQNHIQKQGGLAHPCFADDVHVEPSVFLLDAEDLALATEVSFGEKVYR
jgi:hypothetical protein